MEFDFGFITQVRIAWIPLVVSVIPQSTKIADICLEKRGNKCPAEISLFSDDAVLCNFRNGGRRSVQVFHCPLWVGSTVHVVRLN